MPNEKPLNALGKRIHEGMRDRGIKSQNALAKMVATNTGRNIQGGYISRLSKGGRGERIEPAFLFALADVLGVNPRWLWTGSGHKDNELLAAYREIVDALRGQIRAIQETTGEPVGKGTKIVKVLDKAERAVQPELQREAEMERIRAIFRTGT